MVLYRAIQVCLMVQTAYLIGKNNIMLNEWGAWQAGCALSAPPAYCSKQFESYACSGLALNPAWFNMQNSPPNLSLFAYQ